METIIENAKTDRDLSLNVDEIKKIPKGLYDFLCLESGFIIRQDDYSEIIREYGLIEGTLLCSEKLSADIALAKTVFIGHKHNQHNENAKEFLLWPCLPNEKEKGIFTTVINLRIICGDDSFTHEKSFYERRGVYIGFRSEIKLTSVIHASIFSAIFSYLENYLEKKKS